jgi:hypothetical protein
VNSDLELLAANATPVQDAGAADGLALDTVAVLAALRWVDPSFCLAITRDDVGELQRSLRVVKSNAVN